MLREAAEEASAARPGSVYVQAGRVVAVLDWELATLSDPLFDLGYFLSTVPQPGRPRTPTEDFGTAMLEPG